jgi:hypothetical protein
MPYRVIYRYGNTEVQGLRPYDTYEEAEAEARAASDENPDEA